MTRESSSHLSPAGPSLADLASVFRDLADALDDPQTQNHSRVGLVSGSHVAGMLQGFIDANPEVASVLKRFSATAELPRQDIVKITAACLAALAIAANPAGLSDGFDEVDHRQQIRGAILQHEPEFTVRQEANALTAIAFRNGFLETLHAGDSSELLDDPGLSRITNPEMKRLMVESSRRLAKLLALRETDPGGYLWQIAWAHRFYSTNWSVD